MGPLKIETYRHGLGINTLKLTGFTDEEYNELEHCDYRDAKARVVQIANERNGNIGTCWQHGYGIYNIWTSAGAVFIEIGNACD